MNPASRKYLVYGVAVVSALIQSCATSRSEDGVEPPVHAPTRAVEKLKDPAAEAEYRNLQALFQKKQYDEVIKRATEFERLHRESSQVPYMQNLRGLAYLAQKRPLMAVVQFQRAVDGTTTESMRPYLLFNLASALFDAAQYDDSLEVLKEVKVGALSQDIQAKYYLLQAKNELERGRFVDSARSTLQASTILGAQNGTKIQLVELLDRALTGIQKQSDLLVVASGLENSPLYPRLQTKIQPGLALDSPAASPDGDSRTIGVLLPLSGKFSVFGTRALRSITMALKTYEKHGVQYRLAIEDTGETVEQALKGLTKLVNDRRVAVVLGPLMSKGVDQVTERAEQLGVPMITLTQQPGIKSDYILSAGLTPRLQSRELVRNAIQRLGLKRFAIVYPKDRFGEQYLQSYWDAVEEFGGVITGAESYNPGETDFRTPIKKLVGTFYIDSRQAELDELSKARTKDNITKKNRRTAKYFDLTPIVDFDAVLVPDETKIVSLVLPTFAYQDVDNVQFLGISTWNSPELITRSQNFAENAVFVDALSMQSSSNNQKKFIERYFKDANEAPTSIEAMAYDAALAADFALKDLPAGTIRRTEALQALKRVRELPGVTGKLSYQDGELMRNLTLLQVKNGQIIEHQ